MGKERIYWEGNDCIGGASNSTKKRRSTQGGREMEGVSATPGCMCAVFNFLNLHNLRFTLPHQAPPPLCRDSGGAIFQDDNTARKGVEAPRNSLELNEGILEAASSSLIMKHEENLNIPVGIRIRTSCDTKSPRASTSSCRGKREDTSSSECSGSPGTKSPNLVARLMGLDLLPENGSPSFSSSRLSTSTSSTNSNMHFQSRNPSTHVAQTRSNSMSSYSFYNRDVSGTHSLPETPRISSARKSDVDHHRLSLQILKENVNNGADVSSFGVKKMSRNRGMNLEEHVNAIDYARNIIKQVKEKVSRRAGVDITNTIRSRNDSDLVLKPNKQQSAILRRLREEDSSSTNQSTPSCSPRLSFLETKKKLQQTNATSISKIQDPTSTKVSKDPILEETIPQVQESMVLPTAHPKFQLPEKSSNHDKQVPMPQLRKSRQGFDCILNKEKEPFVRAMATNKSNVSEKKSKRTPLSNELLNNSVPSLLPMRKDASLPITPLRDKQSAAKESDAPQLKRNAQKSTCPSHSYKQERLEYDIRSNCTSSDNSLKEFEQHRYIQRILKRIGIGKATPLSLVKWYSPSHPLDPSIFHYLELFHPSITSKLNPKCQRKLIFHLVDELLVEILRPDIKNSWGATKRDQLCGEELFDILCKKVGDFPEANCEVLEDIDELINMDLERSKLGRSDEFEEAAECIAMSIERDIVGKLLHETVMMVHNMGVRT